MITNSDQMFHQILMVIFSKIFIKGHNAMGHLTLTKVGLGLQNNLMSTIDVMKLEIWTKLSRAYTYGIRRVK